MKVAIIGSGNMGSRYSAILRKYNVQHHMYDVGNWKKSAEYRHYDRYIVSSPTVCHLKNLSYLLNQGKTVLCEKPVHKNFDELMEFCSNNPPFQMINQYRHLVKTKSGASFYNYFKSGADGIQWDCINIIGLASSPPLLSNSSPVWQCSINGRKLNIADMDQAYMTEISQFLAKPEPNIEYILEAHNKVTSGWYKKC